MMVNQIISDARKQVKKTTRVIFLFNMQQLDPRKIKHPMITWEIAQAQCIILCIGIRKGWEKTLPLSHRTQLGPFISVDKSFSY